MIKKLIKIALIILTVSVLLFVVARHGWRLFGFGGCTNPDIVYAEYVELSDNGVSLSGNTSASAPAFVGYIYEISDDGNMYIGMRYNTLFGFYQRRGRFDIEIVCDSSEINAIYFKDGAAEKLVWERTE